MPRRVLNDPSAEPNSPVPWPRTCARITSTRITEMTICMMFRTTLPNLYEVC